MAKVTIINKFGKLIGWNDVTVRLLGRNIEGITEVEYEDESDEKFEPGAGGYPVGESSGNYTATCSITVYAEEMVAMQASLPPTIRIHQVPRFSVVVKQERLGKPVKDIIKNFRIHGFGKAFKNGDGKVVHKCKCSCSHIEWNAR